MRVFVTGGTGFIGRRLTQLLVEHGHDVRCLVRRASTPAFPVTPGVSAMAGDVHNHAALCRGMHGCDALVHLAGVYSMWERDKSVFRRVNVAGTRTVMTAALDSGVAKVIHVSTHLVFGHPGHVLTEQTPLAGSHPSEYARTKAAGERVVRELQRRHGLPVIIVYPTGVLGGGDPKPQGHYLRLLAQHRFPARFAERHVLTWVYVGDVADALVRALEKRDNVGERYLVGQESLSFAELNRLTAEAAGVALPRLAVPDAACLGLAWMLTGYAAATRRPPPWGISIDEARTALADVRCDGSKAERELGLRYTALRCAIEEEVASLSLRRG